MHKEMRIFCSELLTLVSDIDDAIVEQMMQREDFEFK